MDLNELKKKTILVQYIVKDVAPKKGPQRMQYYTSLSENPEKYYLGLSIRETADENKETLERWVKEEKLVKLTEPQIMKYEEDVFLEENGNIILALGHAPWKGKKKIVGSIN